MTNTLIENTPEGLTVTLAAPNSAGIAYFADCDAHQHCRDRIMRWTAGSWEDLHLRVHLAYLKHCQVMDAYA
ncbi:hypothetical protein RB201_04275 [Streptomyces sp. S1A(2023)]